MQSATVEVDPLVGVCIWTVVAREYLQNNRRPERAAVVQVSVVELHLQSETAWPSKAEVGRSRS
jgi:hypothetical protein